MSHLKKVKTGRYLKILSVVFYVFFISILSIELSLRFYGFLYSLPQKIHNQTSAHKTDKKTYKILLLGESTTALPITWSIQLENILDKNNQGIDFQVFNEGKLGTRTSFIVARLPENIKKYNPDIVVTMMGINDDMAYLEPYTESGNSLRVVKFYKWLTFSLRNGFFSSSKEVVGDIAGKSTSAEIENLYTEAMKSKESGDTNRAIELLNKVIEIDSEHNVAYKELGWIYMGSDLSESEKMFKKSIELSKKNPDVQNSDNAIASLISVYRMQKIPDDIIFKKISELTGEESKVLEFFITQDAQEGITYNYKKLYEVLRENNIQYIAMQYPMLPISDIRGRLNNASGVTYVSNKENFESALRIHDYSDLFVDRFASKFGHTTNLGDRLIAENLAKSILESVAGNMVQ